MPYLTLRDYSTYIQADYLRQLVQGNDAKRISEENVSIQAIAQRLVQRYDINAEFTDTLPYNLSTIYKAGQRAVVDIGANGFVQWVPGPYNVGDLVINAAIGYTCTTANTDTVFTPSKWAVIAQQFTIFYAAFPSSCTVQGQSNPATLSDPYAPVFNYKTIYAVGDVVYWRGYSYAAVQPSSQITHNQALQYSTYGNIPYGNVFPDDPMLNATGQYWGTKTAYTIPAATSLTDPLWVMGDNRNQTIKDAMVRITVFKLSPLIAPKNRPDIWLDDYRSILRELNEAAEGKITLSLALLQPSQGLRTTFSSNIKQINNY